MRGTRSEPPGPAGPRERHGGTQAQWKAGLRPSGGPFKSQKCSAVTPPPRFPLSALLAKPPLKNGSWVYLWLILVDVLQKTTKFCKAIILQLKNEKKKKKEQGLS